MENKVNERSNHKVLIVYYSKTGHTQKIAQDIAKQMDAEIEEIIDQKKRTGVLGFITGGRDAMTKKETLISRMRKNPANYKLVILGSPIWAGNIAPAVRTYINRYRDSLPPVAFFFSSGGKTPDQVFEKLSGVVKEKPVVMTGLSHSEIKDDNIYKIKISLFIHSIIKEEVS